MINLGIVEVKPKKEATKSASINNGRALNEEELVFESTAKVLSKSKFKRIPPVLGTLAYLFRDVEGGNFTIVQIATEVIRSDPNRTRQNTIASKVNNLIFLWESLDDASKNRIDVFDYLCIECDLSKKKFYAVVMEGWFDNLEAVNQRILMETKREIIHNSRHFAKEERNFRDRELMASATGLKKESPLIGSIDASTKIQNNITYESSFRSMLKDTEKIVNELDVVDAEIVVNERRMLNPPNMENFVDANIFSKEEKKNEYAERKVKIK